MKMIIKRIVLTLLFLSPVSASLADPDVDRWLRTTPVPIMAWGLDQLEQRIRNQIEVGGFTAPNASVTYRISDKAIIVKYVGSNRPDNLYERSDCHAAIEKGKGYIGFTDREIDAASDSPTDPKVAPIWHKYLSERYENLARVFAGYGYDIPNQPENLGEEIAETIIVIVELNDWAHHEQLSCNSRLLKHDVDFQRKELPR